MIYLYLWLALVAAIYLYMAYEHFLSSTPLRERLRIWLTEEDDDDEEDSSPTPDDEEH
ncbi:MAG: hypothetical protein HUK02_02660 [Bacteroidaceae bacterium]|nr:hypothetical protein [Bacteroidaceae bacterium]